jgi:glycosyltransferase involved in cell wall biosynthesis
MKVSVVTITYNHERYLAQALESALAQRVNFEYEIVVGDDCSKDHTREILMDYYRKHPTRIVPILRERNIGSMPNLGATLAACRGEYVSFLEGDDYWACPDKLQRQADFLDEHPDYAICCARAQILNELGTSEAGTLPPHPAGTYTIEDLLRGNFIMTCTSMCRREQIGVGASWLEKMDMGDWPMHILAARNGKIQLMDEVMSIYRMHAGGIWSSRSQEQRVRETLRMMEALDRKLELRYRRIIRRTMAGFYSEMADISLQEGKRRATGKYLVACLWNGGWQKRGSGRTLAFYAAFALMGSWYKAFFKNKGRSSSASRAD